MFYRGSTCTTVSSDPRQVLMNVLSLRINMSESLAFGRLHPQLQPDALLVDGESFMVTFTFLLSCPFLIANSNPGSQTELAVCFVWQLSF